MEEKISLKQNSFMVFMFNYAPVVIIGVIIALFFHKHIPDWLEFLVVAGIYTAGLVKGIMALKNNNRYLVITDKNITVCKYKRKNPVVLEQFDNDLIEKIEQYPSIGSGLYTIYLKGDAPSILALGLALKPYRETELKVNSLLTKIFGDKFIQTEDNDSKEFISTNILPKPVERADKSMRANRIALTVLNTFLVILPSLLGILAVLSLLLKVCIIFLEFLLKGV